MKLAAMFGSGTNAIGAAAAAAVLIVAGAIGFSILSREDPAVPAADEPATAVGLVGSEVAVVGETPAAEGAAAEDLATEVEDGAAPLIAIVPPTLDLVRVSPDGNSLIAGLAPPGARIAVLLDGVEVMVTDADAGGDFVALLTLAPSDIPRVLSLEARAADGSVIAGEETVLIAPFAGPVLAAEGDAVAPETDVAALAPEVEGPAETGAADTPDTTGADTTDGAGASEGVAAVAEAGVTEDPDAMPVAGAEQVAAADTDPVAPDGGSAQTGNPDPATTAAAPDAAPLVQAAAPGALATLDPALSAAPDVSAPSSPAVPGSPVRADAPAVVIAGPQGLRIAQGPGEAPDVQTGVRLDAISYDAEGAVTLAGRGPAATGIRIYLNNQPIQLGEIGPNGDWSLQLPDVDPGTYTLVVAGLAEDGSEVSRVETPFLREDPERVAEAPVAASAAGVDVITVQPGFTLWGMAQDTFGDGILYVQIFEENREQISDPHWIFPGQIFRMPDLPQAEDGN